MLYKIPIQPLPLLRSAYIISRQTVWRCADERNIAVFIVEGNCEFRLLNRNERLAPGQLLLIPAGEEYVRIPCNDAPCTMAYLHFSTSIPIPEISDEEARKELRTLTVQNERKNVASVPTDFILPPVTDLSAEKEQAVALLEKAAKGTGHAGQIEILDGSLLLLQFLSIAQERIAAPYACASLPGSDTLTEALQIAIRYIREHYDEPLSTRQVSTAANVTPQHLTRLFRTHLNTTPVQYIHSVKVLHAIEMLRSTNLTAEEISYRLGFSDPCYFNRIFKKINGNTPRQERERIKAFSEKK